ncbi:unnamed protein product [Trichogramma brassicae]|uniref:Uncharacterized protein n=1 Tax=Trichogramma brassicae TaxID=86971 RepID=A0A6H5J1F5_9HYME|nr:unnamed protein product [Trichogramma brassicae]
MNTDPATTFSPRKSNWFRFFVHPGDILGAPRKNIDPATTFSEEVETGFAFFVHPGGLLVAPRMNIDPATTFSRGSRTGFASSSTRVTYSVHPRKNIDPATTFSEEVELVSLLRPPGWPTRCTTYEYRPGDDFLPRKSSCFRYFVHPGDIHGAPCMNIDPATTFSEEVKLFSILRPPR